MYRLPICLALSLICLALPSCVTLGPKNRRTISVSGTAIGAVSPNAYSFRVRVVSVSKQLSQALEKNVSQVKGLRAILKLNNIEDDNISTTAQVFGGHWKDKEVDGKTRTVKAGYEASTELMITVTVLAAYEGLLKDVFRLPTADEGDDVEVNRGRFLIDIPRELQDRLICEAFEDAEAKARQLARLSRATLGKPLDIVLDRYSVSQSALFDPGNEALDDGYLSPAPRPYSVSVVVEFEMK